MTTALRFITAAAIAAVLLTTLAAGAAAQQVVRLPDRDRALDGRSQPVFTVGVAQGADHEMFADVAAVAFDADENLYVLDRGNGRVLVFGPTGRFLRQIGRRGEGPGELQAPLAMTVTADGTVAVFDLARRGFSLFARDGTFQRSEPVDEAMYGPQVFAHPRGGVAGTARRMVMMRPGMGPPPADTVLPIAWHPLTPGAQERRIFDAPIPRVDTQTRTTGGNVMMMRRPPPAFSPTVRWGLLPTGGIAVAYGVEYAVDMVSAGGSVERRVERGVAPRRVTNADRERAREERRAAMESGAGAISMTVQGGRTSMGAGGAVPPEMIRQQLETMEFAEVVPVIRSVTADRQGRVWIERVGPRDPFAPGPIDLVAADGRYIGTLNGERMPAAFSAGGLAAYIEVDPDFEIPRVAVRRLPAGWR